MAKRTASVGLGSLATGAVTALAIAVQTGLAAVVGVVIARELGRTAETDGFFAAYGLFIVLALAANALRVTLLPRLARARDGRRLSSETSAYAVSIAVVAVPALVVGIAAARPIADVLTGSGPEAAIDAAGASRTGRDPRADQIQGRRSRIVRTGQGASRSMRSATDPSRTWLNPVRPCVAITIISIW